MKHLTITLLTVVTSSVLWSPEAPSTEAVGVASTQPGTVICLQPLALRRSADPNLPFGPGWFRTVPRSCVRLPRMAKVV